MDGTVQDIVNAAKAHVTFGVPTCLPPTITSSDEDLFAFLANVETVCKDPYLTNIAHIPGVHLEGPYLNLKMSGAQNPQYICAPEPRHYNKILEHSKGLIKRWSVAPELDGALEFIDTMVKEGILVSGAHTQATYDQVSKAYDKGLSLLTHYYNAMSTIVKKNSYKVLGTIEAGYLLDGLFVELICDGIHLPYDLLDMIFKLKDNDHIIACTDSMRGAGMVEGKSILGPKKDGMAVIIEDGIAKLEDRSCFAGSVCTGSRLVQTLKKKGLDLPDIFKVVSLQPATLIGLESICGSIEEGKNADLILMNKDQNLLKVFISGKEISL